MPWILVNARFITPKNANHAHLDSNLIQKLLLAYKVNVYVTMEHRLLVVKIRNKVVFLAMMAFIFLKFASEIFAETVV